MDKIEHGGAGVPVQELEQFVTLAEQFVRNQAQAAEATRQQIDSIAKETGLNPANITRDLGLPTNEPPPPVSTQTGGAKTGGSVRMRAPNGQEADVPADQVEAAMKKGASVVVK